MITISKQSLMAILATSLLIASGNAQMQAQAQTGLLAGVKLGYSLPSGDFKNLLKNSNNSTKDGGISGGFFTGFDYAINPIISVGAEWGADYAHQFSQVSDSTNTGNLKLSLLSIPLFITSKLYVPGVSGLNVFGKVGYAYNRISGKLSDVSSDISSSHFDPVVAAGVGYKIAQFNLFAQYQYNWLKSDALVNLQNTSLKGGLSTISIGASYTLSA
ncbi:outer membrane beta-barrel protein [Cysteiniphilum sp. QT6929]|uniref:outer membrane beta-barrel protein n=1 Tax=Cysteiniphilum sp. QT6929 TaxID=2975055 RepID=UPI0024B3A610|nr:outer membrane beta-barrel protein [Cysteiniphilum sp. QT6929]WHN65116.1 porin family protein [Cysteiniphilum sp. QT6929]